MRRIFNGRRCKHHHIVSGATLIAMAAFTLPLLARARGEQLVKAGAANHPLIIRKHAAWDMDCRAVPYPVLHLDQAPRHGAVCARVAEIAVQSMYAGTEAQCICHVVQGLRLIYFPQPGFTGDDHLRYSVQYLSVRRSVAVTVSVGARAGNEALQAEYRRCRAGHGPNARSGAAVRHAGVVSGGLPVD